MTPQLVDRPSPVIFYTFKYEKLDKLQGGCSLD